MTVELMQTIGLIAYIAAALFFLLGIMFFFTLNIPKIFNDLTGRTEKRAIAAIRQQNEAMTGGNTSANTAKMSATGRLSTQGQPKKGKSTSASVGSKEKAKITTAQLAGNEPAHETTVLPGADNLTTVLAGGENLTTVLSTPMVGEDTLTTVLSAPQPTTETTVLTMNQAPVQEIPNPVSTGRLASLNTAPAALVVEVDLYFAESKELIQ